jgi:hypothetical protein
MRWCIDDRREDMHLRAHDAMRGRGFNSRRLRCGRSTWVTAARHPASTIIFDGPAGLQIARYIAVEPGTRRILRCSPEWLETALSRHSGSSRRRTAYHPRRRPISWLGCGSPAEAIEMANAASTLTLPHSRPLAGEGRGGGSVE